MKFNYASIYQVEGTPRFKADLNEIDEREDRTEERDSGVQKELEEEEEEDLVQRSGREQLPLSVRRPESRDNRGFVIGTVHSFRSTHRAHSYLPGGVP